MSKKTNKPKQRDANILANFKGEIDLQTKSIPSKKKYSRKQKHHKDYKNDY
jgi:hypothetical protein